MKQRPKAIIQRIDAQDESTETRATIRVVRSGTAIAVQLHMPTMDHWSDPMPITNALALIDRDWELVPDLNQIDVIDPIGNWQPNWPRVGSQF